MPALIRERVHCAHRPIRRPDPSGPLARYLRHPGAETGHLLHHVAHLLSVIGMRAGLPVAGLAAAAVIGVAVVRRRQAARLAVGARLVVVLAPPEIDPQGAETLWSNLVALLRPAWRRAIGGQPHLGFEICAGTCGLHIALWVPGVVPAGLVERAIEAAWPGARTETIPAAPPLSGPGVATGGELRLAAAEHYPLRTDHRVDPLRPLLGALSGLDEAESACVQLLARPVTGRRLKKLAQGRHPPAQRTTRQPGRPVARPGHPRTDHPIRRSRPRPKR